MLDNVAWVALAVEPVAPRAQARHSLQRRRLDGKVLGVHTEDAPPSPTNPPIHTHTRCAAAPRVQSRWCSASFFADQLQ